MMTAFESTVQVLASTSSSSSGDSSWFALLFLLTGPAYFFVMYNRYRNAGKRHLHEKETSSEVANLVAHDVRVRSVTGSDESRMSSANHREVRG